MRPGGPGRLLAGALALLAAGLPACAERAGEPPAAPLLRLETASIQRIATDRAGRWLASAADDNPLRLWDAADGRLLTTLRPPAGDGDEGKLFAVAMDPGGYYDASPGADRLASTTPPVPR